MDESRPEQPKPDNPVVESQDADSSLVSKLARAYSSLPPEQRGASSLADSSEHLPNFELEDGFQTLTKQHDAPATYQGLKHHQPDPRNVALLEKEIERLEARSDDLAYDPSSIKRNDTSRWSWKVGISLLVLLFAVLALLVARPWSSWRQKGLSEGAHADAPPITAPAPTGRPRNHRASVRARQAAPAVPGPGEGAQKPVPGSEFSTIVAQPLPAPAPLTSPLALPLEPPQASTGSIEALAST